MAQVKKISVSLGRRPVNEEPSLLKRVSEVLQQHRLLAGIGIGGVVCLVLGMAALSAYWGERHRQGLRELQAGVLSLQSGDAGKAAAELEIAEQRLTADGDGYLVQLAHFKLGQVAERQGDFARARQYYEKSSALDGPVKADALLATAHVLALMKDESASVSYYKKFLEQYQDSPVAEVVRQKVGDK